MNKNWQLVLGGLLCASVLVGIGTIDAVTRDDTFKPNPNPVQNVICANLNKERVGLLEQPFRLKLKLIEPPPEYPWDKAFVRHATELIESKNASVPEHKITYDISLNPWWGPQSKWKKIFVFGILCKPGSKKLCRNFTFDIHPTANPKAVAHEVVQMTTRLDDAVPLCKQKWF